MEGTDPAEHRAGVDRSPPTGDSSVDLEDRPAISPESTESEDSSRILRKSNGSNKTIILYMVQAQVSPQEDLCVTTIWLPLYMLFIRH